MSDIGNLYDQVMEKVANPAAPVKSSKGGMERDEGPGTAYLNQGGGKAGKHVAGSVESTPQPWPGHVNIGDKSPGQQGAGDVGGRGGSPDTGERGTTMGSGDQAMSKSASWVMGANDAIEFHMEKEAIALTDEGHELQAGRSKARRDFHSKARGAEREYAKKAPFRGGMRPFTEASHRFAERLEDHKARKHEQKRNPINPLGGALTKSRSEKK